MSVDTTLAAPFVPNVDPAVTINLPLHGDIPVVYPWVFSIERAGVLLVIGEATSSLGGLSYLVNVGESYGNCVAGDTFRILSNPAQRIGSGASYSPNGYADWSISCGSVIPGDLIVVASVRATSATDNLDSTPYTQVGYFFYKRTTSTGALTVTIHRTGGTDISQMDVAYVIYRGVGTNIVGYFDQFSPYVSDASVTGALYGSGTGQIQAANSIKLSYATDGGLDNGYPIPPPCNWFSDTGDSLLESKQGIGSQGFFYYHNNLSLWEKRIGLPTYNEWTLIGDDDSGGSIYSGPALQTITFTYQIERPNGLVRQTGWRSGLGANLGVHDFTNPITATFPYQVSSRSSLLVVGVIFNAGSGVSVLSVGVSDGYFNPYTQRISDYNGKTAVFCTAPLTGRPALPSQPFQINVTATSPPAQFQQAPMAMGIAEYDIQVVSISATGYLSYSGGILATNSLSVAANTYMIAIGGSDQAVGFGSNWSTYTPLESYTTRGLWEKGDPDPVASSGRSTIGKGIFMDKFTLVAGTFDAQFSTDSLGPMALLAVTVNPVTSACPVDNILIIGVFYTTTLTASGGVAPYTFTLTGGSLPPGLTLNSTTGVISGIPTAIGDYSYQITITDSIGQTTVINCSFTVDQEAPGVCILVPVTTPTPSLNAQYEPLEREGT